jgi:hypothetical protein
VPLDADGGDRGVDGGLPAMAKENKAPALTTAAMTLPLQYAEPPRTRMFCVVLISHPRAAATAARLLASGIRVQTLDSYGPTSATEPGGFVIGYDHRRPLRRSLARRRPSRSWRN